MADKINCKKLYLELSRIKEKRGEFGRVYEEGLNKRVFDECRPLFREIRNLLDGPDTEIGRFRALNVAPELNRLKLHEQYESQVDVAWKSGLFGVGENQNGLNKAEIERNSVRAHRMPAIERGGKKYPMPSWQEVQKTLRRPENIEIIKEKSVQGFTKMLIVPFGYDLMTMAGKFKEKVKELDQEGINPDGSSNPNKGIFGAGGEKVEFNRKDGDYPVYVWDGWDEGQMVFFPKRYDKDNHGGMSKEDAIRINGAWQICFEEDMPVIPLEADEKKDVIGGRKRIDRKGSCIKGQTSIPMIKEYKEAMENRPGETGKKQMTNLAKYKYERGQTPEQYLWMQITSLLDNEKPVLMDYENGEWRGVYLTESYSISSLGVPVAYWYSSRRRVNLSSYDPDDQSGYFGVRPSVNIIK